MGAPCWTLQLGKTGFPLRRNRRRHPPATALQRVRGRNCAGVRMAGEKLLVAELRFGSDGQEKEFGRDETVTGTLAVESRVTGLQR